MGLFRHNAGPAVFQAAICFEIVLNSILVEKISLTAQTRLIDSFCHQALRRKRVSWLPLTGGYTAAAAEFLRMATDHPLGFFRQFAQYGHSEKFEVDNKSESIKVRRSLFFTMPRTVTQTVTILSVSKSLFGVRADCFSAYVSKTFGEVHDCCIAESQDDFKSLHCHGSKSPWFALLPAIIRFVNE